MAGGPTSTTTANGRKKRGAPPEQKAQDVETLLQSLPVVSNEELELVLKD